MPELISSKIEKIGLDNQEFQTLWDAYYKLGEFLMAQKKKKSGAGSNAPKTLYGIWKGIKIDESGFQEAEKSLFKRSL